jgi:hypothetical protein
MLELLDLLLEEFVKWGRDLKQGSTRNPEFLVEHAASVSQVVSPVED